MKNMSSSTPILMTFTLGLLSLFSLSMLVRANESFAHNICNKLQFNGVSKLCIFEVDSDHREDLKSSMIGLLTIFVNHSIRNFNDNIVFLKREINSGGFVGEKRDMFETCLDNFERGTNDLQKSMQILLTQTGIDVYQLPTTNMEKYVSQCVENYEDIPIPREWRSRYYTSWDLLNLILAMTNLIKCNSSFPCTH